MAETTKNDELALFGHGALMMGHCLGVVYHLTAEDRDAESWIYAGVHGSMVVFDLLAAKKHLEDSQG